MERLTTPTPRRAGLDDLPRLLELIEEYCVLDRHAFDKHTVTKALVPLLENDRFGVVWVLGRPALAYAVVTWGYSLESGGADALIDEVYARDRGRGLGTLLMEHVLRTLEQHDVSRVFLETENANEAARRFYSRFGFEVEPSTWMSRNLGDSTEN